MFQVLNTPQNKIPKTNNDPTHIYPTHIYPTYIYPTYIYPTYIYPTYIYPTHQYYYTIAQTPKTRTYAPKKHPKHPKNDLFYPMLKN